MKIQKRKLGIVFFALSLLFVILIVIMYFLFSKPTVSIEFVNVTSLDSLYLEEKYGDDFDPMSPLECHFCDALEGKYKDMQLFWKDSKLPSSNAKDFALLTFHLKIINTSVFDSVSKYLLINDYDQNSELLVVTAPQVVYYEFEGQSSNEEYVYQVYIYVKDKTKEDIKKVIESVQLQVPFSNTVYKSGNIFVDVNDVDIKYDRIGE